MSLGLIMSDYVNYAKELDHPVESTLRTFNLIFSLNQCIDESTLPDDSLGFVINAPNDGSILTITIIDPNTLLEGVFTFDQVWNFFRSSLNFDQYQMVKLLYDTPFGDVLFRVFERVNPEWKTIE